MDDEEDQVEGVKDSRLGSCDQRIISSVVPTVMNNDSSLNQDLNGYQESFPKQIKTNNIHIQSQRPGKDFPSSYTSPRSSCIEPAALSNVTPITANAFANTKVLSTGDVDSNQCPASILSNGYSGATFTPDPSLTTTVSCKESHPSSSSIFETVTTASSGIVTTSVLSSSSAFSLCPSVPPTLTMKKVDKEILSEEKILNNLNCCESKCQDVDMTTGNNVTTANITSEDKNQVNEGDSDNEKSSKGDNNNSTSFNTNKSCDPVNHSPTSSANIPVSSLETRFMMPTVVSRMSLKKNNMKKRILNQTLIIIVAFIICWTPYVFIALYYQIDLEGASQLNPRLIAFLFMFAVSNSVVNPFIYGNFLFRK